MQGKIFEGDYKTRCKNIDSLLCVGDTFDMLKREIRLGDRHAVFYMIDGFLKGEVLEKIMEFFLSLAPEDVPETYEDFLKKCTPYGDIVTVTTEQDFLHYVLSGLTGFVVEGYDEILVIDLRDYPSRSVEEPDKDKVLRGSRDGFVEAIMPNIALIRRRIRDVDLKFEIYERPCESESVIYYTKAVKKDFCGFLNDESGKFGRSAYATQLVESIPEVQIYRAAGYGSSVHIGRKYYGSGR